MLVRRNGLYWSDRVYETWGRGGFLIHPRVDALGRELEGVPCWEWGDWAALRFEVDRWLGDPLGRDMLRRLLQERVRTQHTYAHRARELLEMLEVR